MSTKKIETAINSHNCCFICRRKRSDRIKLRTINKNSIIHAFKMKRIIIDENARCCRNHLDNNGCIKEELYGQIQSINKNVSYV
ncbi:hypothetical protein BpHYR1_008198 [Brachionus plicatilis]|uniref:Uncharacterized protein n=1 Tax=Brachionus plicatilis TaxID=10195 RepID=A0A3M7RQP5_BRAPC|nr:hypothetical protein BpHYR1_008198 [Brachionus plicatilis]